MTDKDLNKGKSDTTETHDPSRRRFIKNTSMVAGGVVGGSLLGGLLTNQFQSDSATEPEEEKLDFTEARMFFTRFEDFIVLVHATERIYPEDENGPGAIGLDVPYFIDKQLAGPWGMNGKDYRQGPFPGEELSEGNSQQNRGNVFLTGLRKMNEISLKEFDATFDKIEEEQQIEILHAFESGDVKLKGVSSASFFQLLLSTTIEGAYSDPLYGGNKNMAGWKMKEFPGPVPSYMDVIESEEFVKMDPISLTSYQQK